MGLTEALAFVAIWSTGGWIASRILGRMDIADVLWGPGIAVANTLALAPWNGITPATGILLAGVWLWALRLTVHISRRNARKSEDARYAAWRNDWVPRVEIRSYLQVFLLQTVLILPMAAPGMALAGPDTVPMWLTGLGSALFVTGWVVETVADRQLADFLRQTQNRGQVMRTGLWAFSRHPNYLGEVVLWWGLGLMAAPIGLAASAVITWLILNVSGVPMLERKWAADPKYADYLRTVPRFWPWSSKTTTS